jgi:hypothetical protein
MRLPPTNSLKPFKSDTQTTFHHHCRHIEGSELVEEE